MRTAVLLDQPWKMGIELSVPMAVQADGLLFSRGQIDVDIDTKVLNAGDPLAQTKSCVGHIRSILDAASLRPDHILHIDHHYRAGSVDDPEVYRAMLGDALGLANPPVTLISVPHFYFEGIEVETDFIASTTQSGHLAQQRPDNAPGWITATGTDLETFLTAHVAVPPERRQDGTAAALINDTIGQIKAAARNGSGSEKTGRLRCFIQAPDTHTFNELRPGVEDAAQDWFVSVTPLITPDVDDVAVSFSGYATNDPATQQIIELDGINVTLQRISRFVFVELAQANEADARSGLAGQDRLVEQTGRIMAAVGKALESYGLGFEHVLKANTYYVGGPTADDLYANLALRDRCYSSPGPASTGVPLLCLGNPGSQIAVCLHVSTAGIDAGTTMKGITHAR